MTVTSHGSMSVGTEEAPGYYPCVRMRRSLDRRTCNVYARNLVAWRSARRRISSADRNTSFNSGISTFGAKNTYTGIPAAKSATDTAICSGSTRTMRRTQNAAPNSGTTILPRSSEAILGCRFANRIAERHVARYATARRNTDALMSGQSADQARDVRRDAEDRQANVGRAELPVPSAERLRQESVQGHRVREPRRPDGAGLVRAGDRQQHADADHANRAGRQE